MQVTDIIEAGGILLRQPCRTFADSVEQLVATLVAHGRLPAALREAAVHAVCERERMASTAIVEIGVSVPHARLPGVDGVVGAIAASPTAVYYAMVGVPITIMALILSPPDRAAEHLNVLASLSILLQSDTVRRGLQEAADVPTAVAVLRAQGGRLR